MPRSNQGSRSGRGSSNRDNDSWSSGGIMEMARERPIAAAAAAAAAVGAGVFLWNRRNQISDQISNLSDQIGEWAESMSGHGNSADNWNDDTAGLTTSGKTPTSGSSRTSGSMGSSRSAGSSGRSRSTTGSRRGMSETGGGNASLGAHSGGIGTTTTGSPSGRGRAADTENT